MPLRTPPSTSPPRTSWSSRPRSRVEYPEMARQVNGRNWSFGQGRLSHRRGHQITYPVLPELHAGRPFEYACQATRGNHRQLIEADPIHDWLVFVHWLPFFQQDQNCHQANTAAHDQAHVLLEPRTAAGLLSRGAGLLSRGAGRSASSRPKQ